MDLSGKTVLVTGAASGLGRLTALRLAARGAKVGALDINEASLSEVESLHPNIKGFVCDVSSQLDVTSAVASVKSKLGSIDRLVHCAAVMPMCEISKTSFEKIFQIMQINFGGTVNMINAVVPEMNSRNSGEIVIFGSVAGEIPMPYGGAYCASKGAVNAFVKQLISENQHSGVKILLVCPPAVNTPLLHHEKTGLKYDFEKQKRHKLVVEPDVVLDKVERALAANSKIVYPTWVAKFVVWFCRIAPSIYMRQTQKSAQTDIFKDNVPASPASFKD